MRTSTTPVALLALPALAYAVTLNDFTPRVKDLPDACNKVYNQIVVGCGPKDFPDCSEACVKGLAAMTQPVKQACGNAGVTGQNIIYAFLSGSGPGSLCVNAGDYLSGSSSSVASSSSALPSSNSPPPTSTKSSLPATSPTSTTVEATTLTSTTTQESSSSSTSAASSSENSEPSTETAVTGTTTTVAVTPSSTAIAMDTSSSPIASETATSTSSSSDSDQTSLSDNSGGGSPFDTLGNLAVHSGATTSLPALSLVLIAAIAALALHR